MIRPGERFGLLVVIGPAKRRHGIAYFTCICDCGRQIEVRGYCLTHGQQSCGCYAIEVFRRLKTKHGGYYTPLYGKWRAMKSRCARRAPHRDWYSYGARGIRVCDSWLHDFTAFREWALSHGYADELTIDRIDPDRGYEPSNCEFVTQSENSRRARAAEKSNGRGRWGKGKNSAA